MHIPVPRLRVAALVAGCLTLLSVVVFPVAALAAPANDNFSQATVIGSLPFSDTPPISGATTEMGEPFACGSGSDGSVWYSFSPTVSATYVADSNGSSVAPTIAVYQQSSAGLSGLSVLACQNAGGPPATFIGQPGVTYYLQVLPTLGPGGVTVNLHQSSAGPPNDNFAQATAISSLPFTDTVSMSGAGTEVGEPEVCSNGSASVWYSFTPTSNGTYVADNNGSVGFAELTVFQQTSAGFGGLSFLTCGSGPLTFSAVAGATYYLQEVSFPNGSVTTNLHQVLPPANDNFAQAAPITSLPYANQVDPTGATREAGEPMPTCGPSNLNQTVWYRFTAPVTESVSANTGGFPSVVAVYTGPALTQLTQVACGTFRPATFQAAGGQTYYLQVSPFSGQTGSLTFSLGLTPPPNANFFFSPFDPSVFDTVQFQDESFDPGQAGIASQAWTFGDGGSAIGCCPTHRYATDGDYPVTLTVTTTDGRTGSASQTVHVRTHDVAITKFTVPQTASAGQTRGISVGVVDTRYPETVQVELLKSVPGTTQFQEVGVLTQSLSTLSPTKTTPFSFNYTFTSDDATAGKVTFEAVAIIQGARDAQPADNTAIGLPTKVTR